jgi:hypothetical protein
MHSTHPVLVTPQLTLQHKLLLLLLLQAGFICASYRTSCCQCCCCCRTPYKEPNAAFRASCGHHKPLWVLWKLRECNAMLDLTANVHRRLQLPCLRAEACLQVLLLVLLTCIAAAAAAVVAVPELELWVCRCAGEQQRLRIDLVQREAGHCALVSLQRQQHQHQQDPLYIQ